MSRKRHMYSLAGVLRDFPVIFRALLGSTPATAAQPKFFDLPEIMHLQSNPVLTKTGPDPCPPLQGECRPVRSRQRAPYLT